MVDALTVPANSTWMLAHVAALLLPYYDKDTPHGIRKIDATYWARALAEYPAWAIEAAIGWWRGADNEDRRKRPMEGDIAARCIREMDMVRAAARMLESPIMESPVHRDPIVEPERPRMTADRAAEIMTAAGFRPRRFNDETEGTT